ncbi:MAG: hypothetical protein QME94_16715 [Anaerolineae bacterium]|nr:hypothetical protein [Anaerolineae bacterium]
MMTVRIRPVELIGSCPAGLTLRDELEIAGMRLENPMGSRVCFLALSHFPLTVWHLQADIRLFGHASCPGCTSELGQENRVIFLLGQADRWELCETISEYRRLWRAHPEPEGAARLRAEAMEHQGRNEFAEASQKMKAALAELRRAAGP